FTERSGQLNIIHKGTHSVLADLEDVKHGGEGGLMGLAVDVDYKNNRYIYTCYNSQEADDVRVTRLRLSRDASAIENSTVIISDMPAKDSGRHSGCRVQSAPDGTLFVGTGDSARASVPQDPQSLGGKILHVDRDGRGVNRNLSAPFDSRI